jgi:hypothetical protein
MCDGPYDDAADPGVPVSDADVTRRSVLGGAVGVLAAVGLGSRPSHVPSATGAAASAPTSNDLGQVSRVMAMHVHSSFSEGTGSMEAQLAEAKLANVDVVWWTDHDWRMAAAAYRTAVHFDSLSSETEAGGAWHWTSVRSGALAAASGGIVTSPVSPNDPSTTPGALQVTAVSAGTAEASNRWFADTTSSRTNGRSNIGGLTARVDVMATQTGPDAWLEMLVTLSRRPPAAGRPPAPYQLSYRFWNGPAGRETRGLLGIVWLTVPSSAWTTLVLRPDVDVAALWPDIQSTDNSFSQMWLGATSRNGAPAGGYFDYLTFQRASVGAAALQEQRRLMSAFSGGYPRITQMQGLEVSYYGQHLNWYGGSPAIFDSSTWTKVKPHSKVAPYVLAGQQVDQIHAGGGLASLNHPFGTGAGTAATAATRHTVVSGLLAARPDLDLIEVGYAARGADLRGHLDLWDTLLRDGWLLPGNGVSDDHQGEHLTWTKTKNRFATCAWTTSTAEADLLSAVGAGRTYCRELGTTPTLDLSAGSGAAHMGQVLVDGADASVDLVIRATGIPVGGAVRVVQGRIELGSAALDPSSGTVSTLPSGAFAGGQATVVLDNSQPSFARVEVMDPSGRCIAFSNPVWLLKQAPSKVSASR